MMAQHPQPLTLEQLDRLSVADLAQLRARVLDPYVGWHPESKAVILALLDNFNAPAGSLSQEARQAYEAWHTYYERPF